MSYAAGKSTVAVIGVMWIINRGGFHLDPLHPHLAKGGNSCGTNHHASEKVDGARDFSTLPGVGVMWIEVMWI